MRAGPVQGRRGWAGVLVALAVAVPARAPSLEVAASDPALDALFELSVGELLEVPVTTASKREQPRWRSPNVVTVISGEAIRRYGYRTLTDVLKTVVGSIPGTDGGLVDHLGLRGAYGQGTPNSHLLWLVDGHRLNDGFFQGGSPGETFPVDLAVVDHVEVVRGPGSALYGSNAFFGMVNVVTRAPGQAVGASLALGAGGLLASPDPEVSPSQLSALSERSFGATLGTALGGVELLVSVTSRAGDGRPIWIPYFTATEAGGVADRKEAYQADKLFLSVRAGDLRLFGGVSHATVGDPMASFGAVPDSQLNRGDVDVWFAELQHEWRLAEGRTLTSRVYVDKNVAVRDWHYTGYWPVDRQDVRSGWAGLEERLALRDGPNRLLLGAELQYLRATQREHYPSEEVAPGVPFTSEVAHTFLDYAVYANDELELGERWLVTAGARLEGNELDGAVLTGRGALVFRPWEDTVLKLQAGQGFLNTSPHVHVYNAGQGGLAREEVTSLELVASQVLEPASLEVTLFRNRTGNLVTWQESTDSYVNAPGTEVLGLEAELALTLASRLSAYASWAWQHQAEPTINVPAWSVKAGAVVRLLPDDLLAAAGEAQVYGPAQYETFEARPGVDLSQPTYAVANLNLTGRVLPLRLAWSLGVQNAFNESYGYPVTKGTRQPFPGAGRSWRAAVELRY